jgi:hypothetical protein
VVIAVVLPRQRVGAIAVVIQGRERGAEGCTGCATAGGSHLEVRGRKCENGLAYFADALFGKSAVSIWASRE